MISLRDSVLVSCLLWVGSALRVRQDFMVWQAARCLVAQVTESLFILLVVIFNEVYLTAAWLAQLVGHQSAVWEVEGSNPRPYQHSGS